MFNRFKIHLFSLVWSCSILFGQDHIQFKNYTINDGLSQSYVSCIAQDELGALWLGTQDGINRFNGKNFEQFTADQGYDISNEYILTVKADNHSNIWFGTYDGLVRYNLKTEQFTSFRLSGAKRIEVKSLDVDGFGNVWIGTAFGNVYRFNASNQELELIESKLFDSAIIDIKIHDQELILVSEYDGIVIADKAFSKKSKYIIQEQGESKSIVVNRLLAHPSEKLLLATNLGVYGFSFITKSFYPFEPDVFSQLEELKVIDVVFLNKDRYFIATENAGLVQVDRQGEELNINTYAADFFQKNTLLSEKLLKLFKDKKGSIWIASQRGISSFDPYNVGFRGVGFSTNLKKGLPSQNIWGFNEDNDAKFLFVAADHGVTRFNKQTHTYDHFYRRSDKNEDFTTLGVHVINPQRILVASIDGLFELVIDEENAENYVFNEIKHSIEEYRGFEKTYTIVPFKDSLTYLVGTKGGLAVFDYRQKEFTYFFNEPSNPESISAGPVRLVFKNHEDRFFFSPSSGNIYEIISSEEEGYKIVKPKEFLELSKKPKDYLTCAIQTSPSEYWLGSLGDGLFYLNTALGEIKQFNKANGLPNNVIYGIEKSPNAKVLWLSTNRGIVKYQIKKAAFTTFSEADGIMSDELNLGASFTSRTGEIYFGGIQGYNYFNPAKTLTRMSSLNVYFSRIEIENEKITPADHEFLSKSISFTPHIRLPYTKRSLNLFFFADDLSNPERIEYKYVLSGDDEVGEVLGKTNQLRFTSLAPGEYTLSVYARNYNTDWNTSPAVLRISVEKPFWLTWWFYSIITAVVALLVIQRVKQSINKERRQQVRLELKIAERTKEIRAKTEKIESQKQKLEEQKLELEKEKEKSERLLNNLLPQETASQLKNDGKSAARDFSMVSVMFTDFVGFTTIAETMSAKELVNILDGFFRKFDNIIEDHDLEKIKTIGDAYMCAGGVPIRNKTNPINTVLAAIRIQAYMQERKTDAISKGESYWKLRVGINTGPVSAGVIGSKKYAYDVWGRTVNRAQRMEQLCEPEGIAVTEDTFEHIEPYFECESKGKVPTKSGVEIMMYQVTSIKPELSENGEGIIPNEAFHKLVNLHFFSTINYYKAERYILNKLKTELSPKLHYHSYDHSKDVTRQAERIAIGEGITDEDLFLLKSAASYHDAGFVKQYEKNEPIGAEMAQEILPNFGYTQAHIDRIKELIFVTQIPHQPKNKLEEIICDADLDYLGRDDFHEIADNLRRELREHGKIDSDRKWDEIQVNFLNMHRFFTRTSIESRQTKKTQNLEEVKARLEKGDYKD